MTVHAGAHCINCGETVREHCTECLACPEQHAYWCSHAEDAR